MVTLLDGGLAPCFTKQMQYGLSWKMRQFLANGKSSLVCVYVCGWVCTCVYVCGWVCIHVYDMRLLRNGKKEQQKGFGRKDSAW